MFTDMAILVESQVGLKCFILYFKTLTVGPFGLLNALDTVPLDCISFVKRIAIGQRLNSFRGKPFVLL